MSKRWFSVDAWFQARALRRADREDAVLAKLREDPEKKWGAYSLSRATGVPAGALYPILAGLEQVGRVRSEWAIDPVHKIQRRFYWLGRD